MFEDKNIINKENEDLIQNFNITTGNYGEELKLISVLRVFWLIKLKKQFSDIYILASLYQPASRILSFLVKNKNLSMKLFDIEDEDLLSINLSEKLSDGSLIERAKIRLNIKLISFPTKVLEDVKNVMA